MTGGANPEMKARIPKNEKGLMQYSGLSQENCKQVGL